mgnify:CR=1 FL=1
MLTRSKSSLSSSRQRGFTLLELMVVLVIIGSLLGMVTVAYQVDDDEELKQVGQSLRLFLQHKIDQSWLDGETLGVKVSAQEVNLKRFDLDDETWQDTDLLWSVDNDAIQISLLRVEDKASADADEVGKSDLAKGVDLAFVASGEYSPFEIHISLTEQGVSHNGYLLTGDGVNALTLSEN